MDKVKELAAKLKALADSTNFVGEKENALELLNKLMEKHNITENDLSDEVIETRKFKVKNSYECVLLRQIAYKVIGDIPSMYDFYQNERKQRNLVGVKCTKSQMIEIQYLFGLYSRQFDKELEFFKMAFIHKHKLFGKSPKGKVNIMSLEETVKLMKAMDSMEDVIEHKLLEG